MRLPPFVVLLSVFAAGAAIAQAGAPTDPTGRWITATGNLEVEIAACGDALCGTVTKVLGNRSMSREGGTLTEPPGAPPALGLTLLKDMKPEPPARPGEAPSAWSGEIYNRENGKTYRCRMSVNTAANPAGELVLRAYIGLPLFGSTHLWQRAGQRP